MSRTIKEALDNYCKKLTGSKPDGTCICDSLEALGGASGKSKTIAATIDAMAAAGFGAQNVVFGEISGEFDMLAAVTELVIPEGVTSIKKTVTNTEDRYTNTFVEFTNLAKVTLPASFNDTSFIFGFKDSPNSGVAPYEVILSDGFTVIGGSAFAYTDISKITIPDSVTTIKNHAFEFCMKLTEIEIPSSVETIEGAAFADSAVPKIIINKPENSIAGAPWGATNATVIWTG